MTKKFIICQGIQGSGKSTWAKKFVNESPENRVRWNNDDFRLMLGKYNVFSREPLVNKSRIAFLKIAMENGFDIVIDDMNLNPNTVNVYIGLVDSYNKGHENTYEIEYKTFNTPLEECIKRDSMRENPIGEKIIRETYSKYKETINKF